MASIAKTSIVIFLSLSTNQFYVLNNKELLSLLKLFMFVFLCSILKLILDPALWQLCTNYIKSLFMKSTIWYMIEHLTEKYKKIWWWLLLKNMTWYKNCTSYMLHLLSACVVLSHLLILNAHIILSQIGYADIQRKRMNFGLYLSSIWYPMTR